MPRADLGRLTRQYLATLPEGDHPDAGALAAAAEALQRAQERWQTLRIGDELSVHWPGHRRLAVPARAARHPGSDRAQVRTTSTPETTRRVLDT